MNTSSQRCSRCVEGAPCVLHRLFRPRDEDIELEARRAADEDPLGALTLLDHDEEW